MTEMITPEMPGGITGNGRMLAGIKENGQLIRLFWPQIDAGQHLGSFYTGLRPGQGETIWLHLGHWQKQQSYREDTSILVTRLSRPETGLSVEQTDFVLPDDDVLVRHYRIIGGKEVELKPVLVNYCSFLIDESPLYDGMYVAFSRSALVQFRRNVFWALAAPGHRLLGYHCGRRNTYGDPLNAANQGNFPGGSSNIRNSAGAVAWEMAPPAPGKSMEITLYLAAAHSEEELFSLLDRIKSSAGAEWLRQTTAYWHGWLPPAAANNQPDEENLAYRRSLITLKLLTNRDTGGIIAAPEFDPYYTSCGGYGYCWPRDGTYAAVALAEAGYLKEAANFYLFTARIQEKDGSWQQRYFTSGRWAPTWGQQIDQVGTVLWGYGHYYRLAGDERFMEQIWPAASRAADYLTGCISPSNGLPEASMDIWEDEFCQSTYAAAAVYAGLTAAVRLARLKGEDTLSGRWKQAAEQIKTAVQNRLWNGERRCFLRAVAKQVSRDDYERARTRGETVWTGKDPSGLYDLFWIGRDTRIDAALLGLLFPFGLLDPTGTRSGNCLESMRRTLGQSPSGGILRYEDDAYAGGNPWIVTTLWLAIVSARQGRREEARSLYRWALANASPTGLLPEQVDKKRGGPAWVLPLAWSHAMFILCHLALQDGLKGL
ncbi:glycoside hydrolase family 15 protein [Desulfotomaculum copahuensis]|uniref:GH15-like domain-containing protein n=1 Tax=Desulfotomaculum copahuensis TaxID=1838280 RepID=A0A1B7LFT9_9FIRM|nr:glycoside hydrolase family 15 protein [Desulfotomaculum copahuensis]OAT83588.1 hypothetical protein A6M21_07835 [Desulfotomaculum copahuensis]